MRLEASTASYRSHFDFFVLQNALSGRTRGYAVLERGVILEFSHRQFPAHAPYVEYKAVWIEHRILVKKPLSTHQHAVDLLQIVVKSFQPHVLDAREG